MLYVINNKYYIKVGRKFIPVEINYKNNDIELIPALAFYKTGNIDNYAKEGANEWVEYNNIIAREVMLSRELSNYSGFALFRYDSIFGNNLTETSFLEKENLKNILSK